MEIRFNKNIIYKKPNVYFNPDFIIICILKILAYFKHWKIMDLGEKLWSHAICYLDNRLHCVEIGGVFCEIKSVNEYGVTQGSVLGPILFYINLNDLFKVPTCGGNQRATYDTGIFYKDVSWGKLKKKVKNNVPQILKFFNIKLLIISKLCLSPVIVASR